MSHNARVLCLRSDESVVAEMRRVNAEDAGIRHMLPKARHYLVKLDSIRRPVAHILKETFLSNGGDAVVSRDLITAGVTHSNVILCGTRKQYQRAFAALLEQGCGCDLLAAEIESAIRHFDSPAAVADPDRLPDGRLRGFFSELGRRTLVMGILNVTPDSFSDGGAFLDPAVAIQRALEMAKQGADIIDVGGESTRPGSEPVSPDEEINRVAPVISGICEATDVPISIDTCKSEVARAALESGASIVNDVSGGAADPLMPALIAERRCPAVLMHMRGTPMTMQSQADYTDLMGELCAEIRERVKVMVDAGADEKMLIIDPGIGFAKTPGQNLEILGRLAELKSIGRPILVGVSRKSTIGKVLGDLPVGERLEGTASAVALSVSAGADIVRVHDVQAMVRVVRVADAIVRRD